MSPNTLGNPNYPAIAGPEILPLASATLPVDQGTEYFFEHTVLPAPTGGIIDATVAAQFAPPAALTLHTVAFELFEAGAELITDPVATAILPLRRVDLGGGASVTGGGTALAALSDVGGAYITTDTTLSDPYVRLWFDPTDYFIDYSNSRIVRIGLRYVAWRDASAAVTPGEGFLAQLWSTTVVTGTGLQYGNWLTTDYEHDAQLATRWLGETNFLTRRPGPLGPIRDPFSADDLLLMTNTGGPGSESFFLELLSVPGDFSQTNVYYDFVEMLIEVIPQRRVGVGHRTVTNLAAGDPPDAATTIGLRWPPDPAVSLSVAPLIPSGRYVLGVREALPASPSDRARLDTTGPIAFSYPEALGPSLQLQAATQPRNTLTPQLVTRSAPISDSVLAGPFTDLASYDLAVTHFDSSTVVASGSFWTGYQSLGRPGRSSVSTGTPLTAIVFLDPATTYSLIRTLVAPDPMVSAPLTIQVQDAALTVLATATITLTDALATTDLGAGQHEVETLLDTPLTGISGPVYLKCSSSTAAGTPWYVLSATAIGETYDYSYDPALAATGAGFSYDPRVLNLDVATTLVSFADTPPAPTGAPVSIPAEACAVETVGYQMLGWASAADAAFYWVERSVDGGATWTRIAAVDNTGPALAFADLGAPWDLATAYRLVAFRAFDRRETTGPPLALGAIPSGGAVFGLADATDAMAYAPVDESATPSLTWTDLSPVDYVSLSGAPDNLAVRAAENRGLAFSVTVFIAGLAACTATDPPVPEQLSVAARSFTPDAWTLIRRFARADHLAVRFPGGATRTMSLALGPLLARNAFGTYLAELVLTDVHVDLTVPAHGMPPFTPPPIPVPVFWVLQDPVNGVLDSTTRLGP